MSRRHEPFSKTHIGLAKRRNVVTKASLSTHMVAASKRTRGVHWDDMQPFAPPEDWYSGTGRDGRFQVVVQPAGPGYRHILTEQDIRARLAELPPHFLRCLEVIQLSRMTRKKQTFPCYGMQWGNSLYLYPLEDTLVEYFQSPPGPSLANEVRMYGGEWVHEPPTTWKLVWSEAAIKDFYLNNILFHELGHLLDDRNTKSAQRERYAEWFAVRYGYLPSRATVRPRQRSGRRPVRRRHHRCAG